MQVDLKDEERQECEVWKDILGYEGKYQVSNCGRVKSRERFHNISIKGTNTARHQNERILKSWKRDRYLLVDLWDNGKRDTRSIHALVYETFKGQPKNGFFIHHKDRNKTNNHIDNLEVMSCLEHNQEHHRGQSPWNKGKKMPPEVHIKVWQTRRNKENQKWTTI